VVGLTESTGLVKIKCTDGRLITIDLNILIEADRELVRIAVPSKIINSAAKPKNSELAVFGFRSFSIGMTIDQFISEIRRSPLMMRTDNSTSLSATEMMKGNAERVNRSIQSSGSVSLNGATSVLGYDASNEFLKTFNENKYWEYKTIATEMKPDGKKHSYTFDECSFKFGGGQLAEINLEFSSSGQFAGLNNMNWTRAALQALRDKYGEPSSKTIDPLMILDMAGRDNLEIAKWNVSSTDSVTLHCFNLLIGGRTVLSQIKWSSQKLNDLHDMEVKGKNPAVNSGL